MSTLSEERQRKSTGLKRPLGKERVLAVNPRDLWMLQSVDAEQNSPIVPPMSVTITRMGSDGLGVPAHIVCEDSFDMLTLAPTIIDSFDTQVAG